MTGTMYHLHLISKRVGSFLSIALKLKRVLSNIIANALQVMQSEASIMMNVRDYDDSFVEIEITNTGSFICADKLSNIFDSFFIPSVKARDRFRSCDCKKIHRSTWRANLMFKFRKNE